MSKDGAAEVHVYQGEVVSRPCLAKDDEAAAVRVKQGCAVRIEPQGRKVVPVAFAPRSFTRTMSIAREGQWKAYIDAVLADKPLGYWPLNEPKYSKRCADRSGHAFHGIPDLSGDRATAIRRGFPQMQAPCRANRMQLLSRGGGA